MKIISFFISLKITKGKGPDPSKNSLYLHRCCWPSVLDRQFFLQLVAPNCHWLSRWIWSDGVFPKVECSIVVNSPCWPLHPNASELQVCIHFRWKQEEKGFECQLANELYIYLYSLPYIRHEKFMYVSTCCK